MSDKPGKRIVRNNAHQDRPPPVPTRLVSKGRYIWNITRRTTWGSVSMLCLAGAIGTFLLTLSCLPQMLGVLFFGMFTFGFLFFAYIFATKRNEGEAVAPITRYNTGDLPAVETLVRASDLPPTQQRAELLRAAKVGQETAPEELLRATTGAGGAGHE